MSKYAEFRGEFDGDDENSSKLIRIAVFDEILFERSQKIDISGVYPPLSYHGELVSPNENRRFFTKLSDRPETLRPPPK